jgi:predicted Zn-dependent protease with MMP-like domain
VRVVHVSRRRFEELAARALDSLPRRMMEAAENVAVLAEDEPTQEQRAFADRDGRGGELLGLYEGTGSKPLSILPRGWAPTPVTTPDRITLFRVPLGAISNDDDELYEHIRATLVHEFGHHFGVSDDQLRELGW